MKKFLALTLALVMLSACALAEPVTIKESVPTFDLTMELPEGAVIKDESDDPDFASTCVSLPAGDGCELELWLAIAPTEEYEDGLVLNDLTEENVETLFKTVSAELENPSYEVKDLKNGHKVMLINESDSKSDFAYIISIHNGYFIQLSIMHSGFDQLTEDEVNVGFAMMDTIVITDHAA